MYENDTLLQKSLKKAYGGGISGALAMSTQVTTLMWLRTTMNYQYRYGGTTTSAIKNLYKDGGILRFYRGFGAAILQAPLSRFGDTAANVGIISYLNANEQTKDMHISLKTLVASGGAATWRIFLMPIDTIKTIMQVEGKSGINILKNKVKLNGIPTLYHGALGACSATFVGHFPWFFTYNYLNEKLPTYDSIGTNLVRNGFIGFSSSVVSDCCSNSIRVIKTTRQTYNIPLSYTDTIKHVIKEDGISGLMGRGLKTRIIANGTQGLLFSIMFKYFENLYVS